jgi:hypothetical protein
MDDQQSVRYVSGGMDLGMAANHTQQNRTGGRATAVIGSSVVQYHYFVHDTSVAILGIPLVAVVVVRPRKPDTWPCVVRAVWLALPMNSA